MAGIWTPTSPEEPRRGAGPWLERLGKWRVFFTGWFLGTRSSEDGQAKAYRDLTDARLALRAEVAALTALLIEHGVFTEAEFAEAVEKEARYYCETLAKQYPGFEATDDGLAMRMPEAAETMRRLGFPP